MERQRSDRHSRSRWRWRRSPRPTTPDPFIASAEYKSSPQLGPAGEKEGPYDWVPPDYWYDTTHFDAGDDSTRPTPAASWGFDSEQSAGNTVPTIDSLNRFLSAADQSSAVAEARRPTSTTPTTRAPEHTGYAFGTLCNLDTVDPAAYGAWSSLASTSQEAQAQNYENTRAQFEAFIDHSTNTPAPSTGTIYWQMNKGWPSLLWTLYNNDGDQAGGYFGAQEANRSLHALYALRQRHRHAGQPGRHHPVRACRWRRRSTARPAPCSTTRPPAASR